MVPLTSLQVVRGRNLHRPMYVRSHLSHLYTLTYRPQLTIVECATPAATPKTGRERETTTHDAQEERSRPIHPAEAPVIHQFYLSVYCHSSLA